MMKMKRILSLVLALVMLVGMFTMVASADENDAAPAEAKGATVELSYYLADIDTKEGRNTPITELTQTLPGKDIGKNVLSIANDNMKLNGMYETVGNTWYWTTSGEKVPDTRVVEANDITLTLCRPVKLKVTTPNPDTTPDNPPTPPTPSYVPEDIYGTYKGAVKISCAAGHHDTRSYDFTISSASQVTMQDTNKAVVYLSEIDRSAYLARYNTDTNSKHNDVTNQAVALVLEYKPGFNFFGWSVPGHWEVTSVAEMEVQCDCTGSHCSGCCGGWWHKHTVTYTDGVKNEVVFKDITYTVKHGDKTPVPADPTRAGYRFTGWTPAVASKTTACVTYTATWTAVKTPDLTSEHVAYINGYGKGLVKPEGEITRAEAITMLYRLMDAKSAKEFYTPYNSFTDVSRDAWYNDAVSTLANAGVLRYTSGKLNPNEAITRAEFFYMLTKFTNATYSGKCTFKDVPSNHWAYDELALAQNLGWIKGYGGNMLHPDDTISRAEVAASLNRVLGRTTCTVKDTRNFSDNPVNAWYYKDIVEASISH